MFEGSPVALEDDLRIRQPALRFISKRQLLKLLVSSRSRLALNPDLPAWLDGTLYLIPPDDRSLFSLPESRVRRIYSRLLFRGEIQARLKQTQSHVKAWRSIMPAQRRELEYVLRAEHRLPVAPNEIEISAAFIEYFFDLRIFQPDALMATFPLLKFESAMIQDLERELAIESLAARCQLDIVSMESPVSTPQRKPGSEAAGQRCLSRGNLAGAASAAHGTTLGEEALHRLVEGLMKILHWPGSTENNIGKNGNEPNNVGSNLQHIQEWQSALEPFAAAAGQTHWPHEKRALYDLQRIITDFSGPLDAVAPIEWVKSFGTKPIRRSLMPVRDVIILRRLRSARKHVEKSSINEQDRHALGHLLESEIASFDVRIRANLGPVIHRTFDVAGMKPANLTERLARERIVAELLDRLSENGFLRLGDLRDAVARNDLKMRDCTFVDFIQGDVLLHIDKRLHEELFGVYHRGEIYLRGVQRFSSFAFGTPLGRWITLFIALPFGGAFLAIEAVKHIAHAFGSLARTLIRLVDGTGVTEASKEVHHAPMLTPESAIAILILGTIILLLIHVPKLRRSLFETTSRIGNAAAALPRTVWESTLVRWIFENRVSRFISLYLIWPSLSALVVMLALTVFVGVTPVTLLAGGAAFLAVSAVNATPWGLQLRELAIEYCQDFGRRLFSEFIPGLVNGILWFFREVMGAIERTLYAIDEWFRFRDGQSKPSLAFKVALALIWFPVAYIIRFAFYLLLEPQVNPIKHFPVVTVSHKVLLPLIPTVTEQLGVSEYTAGLVISGVPGVFGFLAWEFKENWRLYDSNRSPNLRPVMLGHHGETVRGLLRPGFHSGTIPKHFRNLRHAYSNENPHKIDRFLHDEHYLQIAFERFFERNLFAYWATVPSLTTMKPRLDSIRIGTQRVEFSIGSNRPDPLVVSIEHIDGEITARIDVDGWIHELDHNTKSIAAQSIEGFFAFAAVDSTFVTWKDWQTLWNHQTLTPTISGIHA